MAPSDAAASRDATTMSLRGECVSHMAQGSKVNRTLIHPLFKY
jgi:hypothetical protein